MKIINKSVNYFKKDKIIENEINIEHEEKNKEIVIDLKNALSLFNHKEDENKFDKQLKLFYLKKYLLINPFKFISIFSIIYIPLVILFSVVLFFCDMIFTINIPTKVYLFFSFIFPLIILTINMLCLIGQSMIDILKSSVELENIQNKKFNIIMNNNLQLKNNYSTLFNRDFFKLSSLINNLIFNDNYNEYKKIVYFLSNIKNDDDLNKINKYINLCANKKLELKSEFIEDITYSKLILDKPRYDISQEIKNILPIIEFYKENNVRNILNIDFSAYDNILSKYQSYNIISDENEIHDLHNNIVTFDSLHNGKTDKINIFIEIKKMLDENSITDENIVNEFGSLQDNFGSVEIQELKKYKNNLILITN